MDENIEGPITRALAQTDIAFIRIQETDLMEADDPAILVRTATEGYVLVTHDQATLPAFFWERITAGQEHPGLIVIPARYRKQVGDIVRYLEQMQSVSLKNQVWWYPTMAVQEEECDGYSGD